MERLARHLGLITFVLLAGQAWSKPPRSGAAKAEFQRANPCPATEQSRGACPGYVIDHIKPLCAGGPDHPDNMQWQTVEEGKAKDREERKACKRP